MMQNLTLVLFLALVAPIHSFTPSARAALSFRFASSVQVQTLSDESSATEESAEVAAPEASSIPQVEQEASDSVEEKAVEAATENEEDDAAAVAPPKRKVERIRHTAFVGNLPYDTTEAELREYFSQHATVQLINLPKDRLTGHPRGFAFIDVVSAEELDTMVETLNDKEFRERPLRVAKSLPQDKVKKQRDGPSDTPGQKLYVGNLPFDITVDEVKEFFGEYGEIMDVFIPLKDDGSGRGFVFVTVNVDDAEKIIEATNNIEFEGRTIVVNKPLPPGQKAPPRNYPPRKKIYVGNLSFDTISETIESLFGEFGEVYDCYLPTDLDTGSCRGFGFVSMPPEAAEAAIFELDGCEVDGRVIRVNEAMDRKEVSYTMKSDTEDDYA